MLIKQIGYENKDDSRSVRGTCILTRELKREIAAIYRTFSTVRGFEGTKGDILNLNENGVFQNTVYILYHFV